MRSGRSAPKTRIPLSTANLAKSAPASYAQFQAAQAERRNQIAEDLNARKTQEIREMQFKLQELLMQVQAAQTLIATEERDFLTNRDSLQTELSRIQNEAEVKFSQAQVQHLNRKEQLQRKQEEDLHTFTQSVPTLLEKPFEEEPEVQPPEYENVKQPENSFQERQEDISETEEPDYDEDLSLYTLQISRLETQKRELLQVIRDEQHNSEAKIRELTTVLNEEESEFNSEVERFNTKVRNREEAYKRQLGKLYAELDGIQERRKSVALANQAKFDEWQTRIEQTDEGFRSQLRESTRIAEALKASLTTANLRKGQQLETERKRSQDQNQLRREAMTLEMEVFNMQKQVQKAKEEFGLLRRELNAKLGTRRTASLFM